MIAPKGNGQATPLCYASSERIECMNLTYAKVWRGLAIAALLMGGAARQIAAQQAPSEPTLVGVRIVREDGTVLKDAPAGVPAAVGEPLDRTQVAASPRALYRRGGDWGESAGYRGANNEQHGITEYTDYGTAEDEGGNGDYEWANPKRDGAHPEIPGKEGPFERTGGGEARRI